MTDNNINYLAKLLELKDNMPFCTYKEEARWLLENGVKITAFQDGLNEAQDLYAEQVKTEIKHEAYKEFSERLKERAETEIYEDYEPSGKPIYYKYQMVDVDEIDNLVKEFEKKENTIYDN